MRLVLLIRVLYRVVISIIFLALLISFPRLNIMLLTDRASMNISWHGEKNFSMTEVVFVEMPSRYVVYIGIVGLTMIIWWNGSLTR